MVSDCNRYVLKHKLLFDFAVGQPFLFKKNSKIYIDQMWQQFIDNNTEIINMHIPNKAFSGSTTNQTPCRQTTVIFTTC